MKRLLYLLVLLLAPVQGYAQMLFTENQTMHIDSTKTLQGTITPVVNFQTEKENVLTLRNTSNINLLIKKSRVVNLISKFELSTYGDKVTVSGGYVHADIGIYCTEHLRSTPMSSRSGRLVEVWDSSSPQVSSPAIGW